MKGGNVRGAITIGATAATVSMLLIAANVPLMVSCGLGVALFYILMDEFEGRHP